MAKTDPFSVAASQILCKLYCRPALGQFSNYNCRRALREQFLTASFAELCELTNSTRPRHDGPEFQLDPENVFRFLCHGFSKFAVDFYRAIQIKLLGTLFLLNTVGGTGRYAPDIWRIFPQFLYLLFFFSSFFSAG